MCYDRKVVHKREMMGCAQIGRAALRFDTAEEAAAWKATDAEHLFKLGGLVARW